MGKFLLGFSIFVILTVVSFNYFFSEEGGALVRIINFSGICYLLASAILYFLDRGVIEKAGMKSLLIIFFGFIGLMIFAYYYLPGS